MVSSSLEQVQEQLQVLRLTYVEQLPNKLAEIEQIWQAVRGGNLEEWTMMHCLVHRLAGSGATFGLQKLSEVARSLELILQPLIDDPSQLTPENQQKITTFLTQLREASDHLNIQDSCVITSVNRQSRPQHFSSSCSEKLPPIFHNHKLIFLIEDDPLVAADLKQQISYFGYQVEILTELLGLEERIKKTPPAAIIMDVMFPEGRLAGIEIMVEIQKLQQVPIPVMFISVRNDIAARLQAVRAGGAAYFPKPVDISSLIDKLDSLTAVAQPEPFRILIIEDDQELGNYYALILEEAGMTTIFVNDPLKVMHPLAEFKPDLILMDMYMPGCNGLELAAVIRQQDAYVSIPIVFLSVETDPDKHLAAMHLGGDEFLTKPINPDHLISEVISRSQRSRILRSYMIRDSLTGLLNHTNMKEQLTIEVARAKRERQPLSFVMIDIDNFKSVNDAYGHLTGDRVIRSLSRLLQQRLRKTDIIGRYGGEEFAVILPNTAGEFALQVIEEIAHGFAQVRHQSEQEDLEEFSVTFSGGIATFPECKTASILNDMADRALYQAKRKGRDQVLLAS